MPSQVFRQTSLDRLESPEQLNQYVRVARPSVWIVLAAVILALAGILVWALFGTVSSDIAVLARAEDGHVTCYVGDSRAENIEVGQKVTIGDSSGSVTSISSQSLAPDVPDTPSAASVLDILGLEPGEGYREIETDIPDVEDGTHIAEITVETIHPITFVIQ